MSRRTPLAVCVTCLHANRQAGNAIQCRRFPNYVTRRPLDDCGEHAFEVNDENHARELIAEVTGQGVRLNVDDD